MNLRLKTFISESLSRSGILGAAERVWSTNDPIVFTLHRVLPIEEMDDCYNSYLAITPQSLELFLGFLTQQFAIVPLGDLVSSLGQSRGNKRRCAITFDDGWEDNYRNAYPILRRFNVPATIFLCTGLIGTRYSIPEERFWRLFHHVAETLQMSSFSKSILELLPHFNGNIDYSSIQRKMKHMRMTEKTRFLELLEERFGSYSPERLSLMAWDDIRGMQKHDITFASHTIDHALLATEDEETIRKELITSKQQLEMEAPGSPHYLAYPNGSFDGRVLRIASECGYVAAFTTESGAIRSETPPFRIPRLAIDNHVVNDPTGKFSQSRTRLHILRGSTFSRESSEYYG